MENLVYEKDGIVRFREPKNRKELEQQMEAWNKLAEQGKELCLTDMLHNIAVIALKEIKGEERVIR